MTDINVTIARHRGWIENPTREQLEVPNGYPLSSLPKWFNPETKEILNSRDPNFQGDPRLYMGLFEEIKKTGFDFRLESDTTGSGEGIYTAVILEQRNDTNGTGWGLRVISTQSSIGTAQSSIGTAICLAYMRLNGLE